MAKLSIVTWIGIALVVSVLVYGVSTYYQVSNYRKEIRYDDCVVNEFNRAWHSKSTVVERDRRILEVCRRFAPQGPLYIDVSNESFLVIRGPKRGYLVCWKSSDPSSGIDGTLWVQRGLNYR